MSGVASLHTLDMHIALVELLRLSVPMEAGRFCVQRGGRWFAVAGFDAAGVWAGSPPASEAEKGAPVDEATSPVPAAVLEAMGSPLAPLVRADVSSDPHLANDADIRRRGIRSLHALPVRGREGERDGVAGGDDSIVGLIYLENRQATFEPDPQQLEALRLIGLQFADALADEARCERLERELAASRTNAAGGAQRDKGDFLATMGHEIRTPMNAILGMSHLALRSGLNPQQQNYIQKVERSAESLLRLIDDILDFSKIEAGKLEVVQRPFEFDSVMTRLAESIGQAADEKGLELVFDQAEDVPAALIGDPSRLGQILVNLVRHAIEASDRGEIVVGVAVLQRQPTAACLRFSVRDSSAGLTPGQQRLLRPFSPGEAAAARRDGSSGLGLAISFHLAALLGGAIRAESEPGRGSTFTFDLPFGLRGASGEPPAVRALPGDLQRARVLVVDDNATARGIVAARARHYGWHADEARDAWDALRAATLAVDAGAPYDVALIDWKMPSMDGVECARQLQDTLRRQAPALVLMTAFGRDELRERLAALGIERRDVLDKPVTAPRLFDAVALALGHAVHRDGSSAARRDPLIDHRVRLRGARILLVEDNVINQELALELLSEARMAVTLAENGRAALEALQHGLFDGVLMDCQMPEMDGYEATREIRRHAQWRTLPIIAMTADATSGDRERALAAGMNDHIAKPIVVEAMFETISRWLRPEGPRDATAGRASDGAAPSLLPGSLPGIDLRIGRVSTMGNDKLYRRLLIKFRDSQRAFAPDYRASRARGEAALAARLVHDLRAVAGSLGAKVVQQQAQALDRAQQEGLPQAQCDALMEQLAAALDAVVAGLEPLGTEQA